MRRAAKIDRNQPEIVAALRQAGAMVVPTHAVGNGFPDLIVLFRGVTMAMEVKDGAKPPSARALTPDQQKFHAAWTGGPLCIVKDVEGALRALGVISADSIQPNESRT